MGFTRFNQMMEEEMKSKLSLLLVAFVLLISAGNAFAAPSRSKLYVMIQDLQTLTTELQATNDAQQATIDAQQATIAGLNAQLATVEANPVLDLGSYVSVDQNELDGLAGPHVIFQGINVHVRNALGATRSSDGLGNLIIGYNEPQTRLGFEQMPGDRAGSHNLVIGDRHKYLSFAGFIHGYENTVTQKYGAAVAGHMNVVGNYSAAIGGHYNTVGDSEAVAVGGEHNTTVGSLAVVTGGAYNSAVGRTSTVSGGSYNTASGDNSSVSGGTEVQAVNNNSWAAGTLSE